MHAGDDPLRAGVVRRPFDDGEQLDHVPRLRRPGDVVGGDGRDALAVHVSRAHAGVEGERGEDRGLGRGVEALDVGGRVGLGVAVRLGLLDGEREVLARRRHLVEHVVGGAVHDAEDARDAVARERLAHGPDQRDRPADGGLEVQVDPGLLGRRVQRGPVLAQQLLVRGHHGRPGGHRPEDHRPGGFDAADQLDDDVRPGGQLLPVGGDQLPRDHRVTLVVEASARRCRRARRGRRRARRGRRCG